MKELKTKLRQAKRYAVQSDRRLNLFSRKINYENKSRRIGKGKREA